jgi:hypothetical protein
MLNHNFELKHVLRKTMNTSGRVVDVTVGIQTRHFRTIIANIIHVCISWYRALDVKLTDSTGKKNPLLTER